MVPSLAERLSGLPDPLWSALAPAVAASGPLLLPRPHHLPAGAWVRTVWRRAVAERGAWFPLVQPGPLDAASLAEVAPLARGGWLDAEGELPETAELRRVVLAPLPTLELLPEQLERIDQIDRFALLAGDPELDAAGRSLLLYAQAGARVLLTGGERGDALGLVQLTAARLGCAERLWMGQGRPKRPGDWWVGEASTWTGEALRDPSDLERARTMDRPGEPGGDRGRPTHPAFRRLLGESPALLRLLREAERVAPTRVSVLILGESGTGKELLARALHEASRPGGPFEAVDLSAVPRELVESELFGHVRGAFTGAHGPRAGALTRAHGGTLFLDELGNLDPATQAKLLRVLQERRVRPVGSDKAHEVDVRLLAATNADLDRRVEEGGFRLDLLHRINTITLRLPPLRDRGEDILLLTRVFLAEASGAAAPPALSEEAREALLAAPWPGNVRELWSAAQRAVIRCSPGEALRPAHFGLPPRGAGAVAPVFLLGEAEPPDPRLAALPRIALPSPATRGEASARHRMLITTAGSAVTAEAWELFRQGTSGGSSPAALAELRALRATVDGPLTAAALKRALPHLFDPQAAELLVQVRGSASDEGFERALRAPWVLIGRARGEADLRDSQRLVPVLALTGGAMPAFLSFSREPGLSRAHVLARRDGGEVELRLAPGAQTCRVRGADGARALLEAGATLRGPAFELNIPLGVGAGRELSLLLFAGRGPRERHLSAFLRAEPPEVNRLGPTWREGAESADAEAARVWVLNEDERRRLNQLVRSYDGRGDFSAWLRAGLQDDPGARRLAGYLLRVRPAQYCARLYEHPGNHLLLAELRDAGAPPGWLDGLPAQVRKVLQRAWGLPVEARGPEEP